MLFYFAQITDKENLVRLSADIRASFEMACAADQEFLSALESTTKSLSAVHHRFRKWGELLIALTGEQLMIPEG